MSCFSAYFLFPHEMKDVNTPSRQDNIVMRGDWGVDNESLWCWVTVVLIKRLTLCCDCSAVVNAWHEDTIARLQECTRTLLARASDHRLLPWRQVAVDLIHVKVETKRQMRFMKGASIGFGMGWCMAGSRGCNGAHSLARAIGCMAIFTKGPFRRWGVVRASILASLYKRCPWKSKSHNEKQRQTFGTLKELL